MIVDATSVTAAMRLESAACHRECVIQTANPNHYHITLDSNVYPFELHQHSSAFEAACLPGAHHQLTSERYDAIRLKLRGNRQDRCTEQVKDFRNTPNL